MRTRNCISIWSESIWFTAEPAGPRGLPNHPTIGKQSLLLPAANSIQPTRVSYFPQSINSYFYSTSVSYFLQSINSVQSWSPPHTLTYEEEIAALVSRFIDLVPSSSWNWKKKPPSFCFVIVKRPCKLSHINKRRRK